MGTSRGKLIVLGGVTLAVMSLAACGSATSPGSSPAAGSSVTPRLVTPKPVGGSPAGHGPRVVTTPARLPGGKIGSQKVVLGDRIVIINRVTSQQGANKNTVLIDLVLVVRNTSGKAIRNEAAFFHLMGPGGDMFGYQDNSSDNFYGTIGAHGSRGGMIEFEVPAAAASGLSLLYRPEIASEAVLTRLHVG
jgi:hypothetical protein